MKPQVLAATLFATLTLGAGVAWSLSCAIPIEVETTTLEIVTATVDGEEVDLTRYQRDRAPILQADWAQSCDGNRRRPVVWIGEDREYERVTFIGQECGGSP